MESYKHQFAKRVLVDWLRVDNGYPLVDAKPNRTNADLGVYTEYPICLGPDNRIFGVDPLWDESREFHALNKCVPSYQDCIDLGLLPIVIFDVVMLHKGLIGHAFEIVHKHPLSETKRDYLKRVWATGELWHLHVIDADWILSQVQRPTALKHIELYNLEG